MMLGIGDLAVIHSDWTVLFAQRTDGNIDSDGIDISILEKNGRVLVTSEQHVPHQSIIDCKTRKAGFVYVEHLSMMFTCHDDEPR